ncbi:MAG: hypothetical protein ACK5IA_04545, partial [Cyanobacteriota bacterium]
TGGMRAADGLAGGAPWGMPPGAEAGEVNTWPQAATPSVSGIMSGKARGIRRRASAPANAALAIGA